MTDYIVNAMTQNLPTVGGILSSLFLLSGGLILLPVMVKAVFTFNLRDASLFHILFVIAWIPFIIIVFPEFWWASILLVSLATLNAVYEFKVDPFREQRENWAKIK